jgi:putative transposase
MLKNRHLSQALSDVAFGQFIPMITYKLDMYGGQVIKNDCWFASTKTCYACGIKNNNITLADREWTCPKCGTTHDRDVNAAKNLVPPILRELTPLEITLDNSRCAGEISINL